jgi:hypothetical protein
MPHWNSQDPSLFGWQHGPAAAIDPFTYHGHAFPGGVARGTDLIFRTAIDRCSREPGFKLAESAGLDAGMWGYADRPKRGSSGWSFHAFGLAVDVNAPWNPQSWQTPRASPYRLPVNTAELVRPLGLLWGGGAGGFGDWPTASQTFPLPPGCYYGPYSGPASSISGRGLRDGPYRAGLAAAQTVLHVTPDGYYGPITAAATVRFQAAHGLTTDGLIGPRTWAKLFG